MWCCVSDEVIPGNLVSNKLTPCKFYLLRFAKMKDKFELHFECQEQHKPNFDFVLNSIHDIFTEILSISLYLCVFFALLGKKEVKILKTWIAVDTS